MNKANDILAILLIIAMLSIIPINMYFNEQMKEQCEDKGGVYYPSKFGSGCFKPNSEISLE